MYYDHGPERELGDAPPLQPITGPDILEQEARRFLQLLDPTATVFTFQTAQDRAKGVKEGKPELARVFDDSTVDDPLLRKLYECGAAVWVTVNRTDLMGRKVRNVTHIRAVWQEDDDGYAGSFPLAPSITVESSPGRYHRYWLTDCPTNEQTIREHRGVMEHMVASYGSDPGAKDIARVLRVPGFLHRKGEPFMVRIVDAPGHRYRWEEIVAAFPPIERANGGTHTNGNGSDGQRSEPTAPLKKVRAALRVIPTNVDRAEWINVGLATHAATGGSIEGLAAWDEWSQRVPKYEGTHETSAKWAGFKPDRIGAGSLFMRANNAAPGWEDGIYLRGEGRAREETGDGEQKAPSRMFYFDDCATVTAKAWLLKGLIARGECSTWIAPPGKGKSGLLTAIAVHVAAGKDLGRFRSKGPCGVLYLALERAAHVRRRLTAYTQKGFAGLPVAVRPGIINLMDPACIEIIVAAIREAEQRLGVRIGLVIIDTFAKGIAAGGGNESSAQDQGRCLAHLQEVRDQTDCHTAIIHHTGKDVTKGARGSNAQVADVDVEVTISGAGIRVARVTKANDQPEGELLRFSMASVTIGADEDGEDIVVGILAEQDATYTYTAEWPTSLARLRKAIDEAVIEAGFDHHIPRGPTVKAAHLEIVRGIYRQKHISVSDDPKRPYGKADSALQRDIERASQMHLIGGAQVAGKQVVWVAR